jgi:hypothetical protein
VKGDYAPVNPVNPVHLVNPAVTPEQHGGVAVKTIHINRECLLLKTQRGEKNAAIRAERLKAYLAEQEATGLPKTQVTETVNRNKTCSANRGSENRNLVWNISKIKANIERLKGRWKTREEKDWYKYHKNRNTRRQSKMKSEIGKYKYRRAVSARQDDYFKG